MAEECRTLAAMFESDSIQSKLLEIAEHLDQWADEAIRNGAGQPEKVPGLRRAPR